MRLISTILILFFSITLVFNTLAFAQTWKIEEMSGEFDSITGTSIKIDDGGNVHVFFGRDGLFYSIWNGESWSTEKVDSGAIQWVSFDFDSNNLPHVAYHDQSTIGILRYAYHDGTSWIKQTIDDEGHAGWAPSLAIDSNDRPHISYCAFTNKDLKYMHWNGNEWQSSIVDEIDDVGRYSSIALDNNDKPSISYYNRTSSNLKFASLTDIGWINETIDDMDYVGEYPSLKFDSNGNPHISYWGRSQGNPNSQGHLKYAYIENDIWMNLTLNNSDYVGGYTSLALDSMNHPHIGYKMSGLKVVYTYFDGINWQSRIVEDGHDGLGNHLSLTLNKFDRPYMSYSSEFVDLHCVWIITSPSEPQNVIITSENQIVHLTWNCPNDNGGALVSHYKIFRGLSYDNMSHLTTLGDVNYFNDTGVSANHTYFYKICAETEYGDSTFSSIVNLSIEASPQNNDINDDTEETPGFGFELMILATVISFVIYMKRR